MLCAAVDRVADDQFDRVIGYTRPAPLSDSVGGAELTAERIVAGLATLVTLGVLSPAQAGVDRPPQFVVMAFDNCTELERWQELTDFAAELNRDGDRIHFAFFVSGSNFIADPSRNIYEGPHQRRGYSRISFGGTPEQVRKRVEYVNALYRDGHEIASHAVGHFNGAAWSVADWEKEFRAFGEIVKKVGPNNGLADAKLAFAAGDVIGFRAPYLAKGTALYSALKTFGFRYDTSGVGYAGAWPEKIDGLWRYRASFHELWRRRLQRGVKVIRTRGLRVAGSALRDLCQAGRFHGSAERGNARGLSQGRFCTRCDTEVERGASVAIAATDGMLATGPPPCRHAGLPFFPPPSPASRVYASVPSDSR